MNDWIESTGRFQIDAADAQEYIECRQALLESHT